MREIRMSGLMSGEGKRARTTGSRTAPLLDSTDQGQEAAYSRRHPRPADPRHRARRRHSGSRWRRVGDDDDVRPVSVPAETLCRWWLSRPGVPPRCEQYHGASECRDRQALGSRQRLCRAAKAMGGRTHIRMARALPTARQGLGKSQSKGARVPAPRLYQADVEKAMQSRMISPDRLLEPRCKLAADAGVI